MIFMLGVLVLIKIAAASVILISGIACYVNENTCSISNDTSMGFIGTGIGIVVSSIFSLIILCLMSHTRDKHNLLRKRYIFVVKSMIGLAILILGIIIYYQDILTGCRLIGVGTGIIIGTIISVTLLCMCVVDNVVH